jgi:hypothetical protein
MTQYAYPNAMELDLGGWDDQDDTIYSLYAAIDDTQPLTSGSDSTYIYSEDEWGTEHICTIPLGDTITNPGPSASSHIVYFRVKGTDDSGWSTIPDITVDLVEGATDNDDGTVHATTTFTPTSSFADRSLVLDSTESGNISDYTDLQLRFTRAMGSGDSEMAFVSQAYFATPDSATPDFRVGDRIKETGTGTTGDINLAGAATGYQTFVAGVGDENVTYYVIEDANGTAWETGLGKVTDASPDTLSRDRIIANSSGTTSAITLSGGTHTIFCGSPSRTEMSDIQIKTTTYTVTQADSTILCDSAGGAFTVTMPTAGQFYVGLKFLIKKSVFDTNVVTIASSGNDFEFEDSRKITSYGTDTLKLHLAGDFYELTCIRVGTDFMWLTTNKYLAPHVAMITQTVSQTIANETSTQVTFDTNTIEKGPDADHANNKITIKRAGVYNLSAYLRFSSMDTSTTGAVVKIGVTPDGGSIVYYKTGAAANWAYVGLEDKRPTPTTSVLRECAVDDVITLYTYQDDQSSEVTLVNDGTLTPYADWQAILSVQEVR